MRYLVVKISKFMYGDYEMIDNSIELEEKRVKRWYLCEDISRRPLLNRLYPFNQAI